MGAISARRNRFFEFGPLMLSNYLWLAPLINGTNIQTPLASEKNGYWSASMPAAKAGDEYRFVLQIGERNFSQSRSLRAKIATNSVGNAIVPI